MPKTLLLALMVIAALVLLTGVGLAAYRLGRTQQNTTTLPLAESTPTVALLPSPTPPVFPSPTLLPTSTVDETSLIKQAIFAKTGLDESQAEVTISQNTGQHAKGNIREFEAVGGGYWLAAKVGSGWVAVYDGQANPTCTQIAPYNFPKAMVPECLDASGRVITR